MDIKDMARLSEARVKVNKMCDELGLDLKDKKDWNRVLTEIDKRHNRKMYKCKYCWDSGIVTWVDMDDGMLYGRRCGFCRYWDEQRAKARAEREARGVKE